MASQHLGGEPPAVIPKEFCTSTPLTGVVDAKLRVYGVSNLRIVDASIMPMIVGAHLQATVYAIAEKVRALLFACHRERD
jgi:choline dehydrogenase-like flavoprotein